MEALKEAHAQELQEVDSKVVCHTTHVSYTIHRTPYTLYHTPYAIRHVGTQSGGEREVGGEESTGDINSREEEARGTRGGHTGSAKTVPVLVVYGGVWSMHPFFLLFIFNFHPYKQLM
ncbi:hypothetical protein EON63_13800 [archaeon]|nr:MAG: hypothetical protein EON63_13800 [archaeon]